MCFSMVTPPVTIGASFTLLTVIPTVADGSAASCCCATLNGTRFSGTVTSDGVACTVSVTSASRMVLGPTVIWPVAGSISNLSAWPAVLPSLRL